MRKREIVSKIFRIAVVWLFIGSLFYSVVAAETMTEDLTWNVVVTRIQAAVDADNVSSSPDLPVSGKGIWIWRLYDTNDDGIIDYGNLNSVIEKLDSVGVDWVIIKFGDGIDYWPTNPVRKLYQWLSGSGYKLSDIINGFHNAGIKVFGWHFVYGDDPIGEAAVANKILDIGGIDGLIVNAEEAYDAAGPEDSKASQAKQYMQAIRNKHPNSFIAYCSFNLITNAHPWFPWLEFGKYCDANMPQCPWAVRNRTPEEELRRMKEDFDYWHSIWIAGGHADSVKPIIPVGQGGQYEIGRDIYAGEITSFCNKVQEYGYQGLSLYRYGIMDQASWDEYAACWRTSMPITTISASEYQTDINVGETDWVKFTVRNDGTEYAPAWGIQVRVGDGLELVQNSSYPWSQGNMCPSDAVEWWKENDLGVGASDNILVGIKGKTAGSRVVKYTAWMYDPDGQPQSVQYSDPIRTVPCDRDYAQYGVTVTCPTPGTPSLASPSNGESGVF
jgi:hypothetical protein